MFSAVFESWLQLEIFLHIYEVMIGKDGEQIKARVLMRPKEHSFRFQRAFKLIWFLVNNSKKNPKRCASVTFSAHAHSAIINHVGRSKGGARHAVNFITHVLREVSINYVILGPVVQSPISANPGLAL